MSAFTDKTRLAQIIELGLDCPDGSDLRILCEAFVAEQAKVVVATRLAEAWVRNGTRNGKQHMVELATVGRILLGRLGTEVPPLTPAENERISASLVVAMRNLCGGYLGGGESCSAQKGHAGQCWEQAVNQGEQVQP